MFIQAVHRLARLWDPTRAGDVDAPEVHLRAPFGDRELDRSPAEQVGQAGMGRAMVGHVGGVDGREAVAVAEQDEAGQRLRRAGVVRVRGHEVDEVACGVRAPTT